jgi:hypothetical protein
LRPSRTKAAGAEETHAVSEWAQYRHLFPHQPDRTRFNRHRRNLMGGINQIRLLLVPLLDVARMPTALLSQNQLAQGPIE